MAAERHADAALFVRLSAHQGEHLPGLCRELPGPVLRVRSDRIEDLYAGVPGRRQFRRPIQICARPLLFPRDGESFRDRRFRHRHARPACRDRSHDQRQVDLEGRLWPGDLDAAVLRRQARSHRRWPLHRRQADRRPGAIDQFLHRPDIAAGVPRLQRRRNADPRSGRRSARRGSRTTSSTHRLRSPTGRPRRSRSMPRR